MQCYWVLYACLDGWLPVDAAALTHTEQQVDKGLCCCRGATAGGMLALEQYRMVSEVHSPLRRPQAGYLQLV